MTSSNWKATTLECPCGDSSRGFSIRIDGTGHCFNCGKNFDENKQEVRKGTKMGQPIKEASDAVQVDQGNRGASSKSIPITKSGAFKFQYLPYRGVKADTWQALGCKTAVSVESNNPEYIQFPYPMGRTLCKRVDDKQFWWEGEKVDGADKVLFGQDVFPAGSAKAVTVTEGALDAASVYQMFGKQYPTLSVASSSSAKTECAAAYDYLNSFDKIYLCFDADDPGKKAMKDVARLFDFNKVYVVDLQLKDANDYLTSGKAEEFKKTWWAARRFLPEGILSTYSDFDKIIDEDQIKPSVPYPFTRLQDMTYGIRTGEVVLLTAQEGIGKTEIMRALEYHLLKTTDDNIGIVHLEENKARTLKGLVGYEVQRPIHLPDFAISKEEVKNTLRKVTKRDDRVHIYSHFGSDDPDVILSTIRFMAGSCNCKYVFLDHITMVVTGLAGDDERRALDYISTRLAMMTQELDFTLFLVSHVNDQGQTRGSRNISKIADLRIDMTRNVESENEDERNTTHLMISKNRYSGKTGPSLPLKFDLDTYILSEIDPDALPF